MHIKFSESVKETACTLTGTITERLHDVKLIRLVDIPYNLSIMRL